MPLLRVSQIGNLSPQEKMNAETFENIIFLQTKYLLWDLQGTANTQIMLQVRRHLDLCTNNARRTLSNKHTAGFFCRAQTKFPNSLQAPNAITWVGSALNCYEIMLDKFLHDDSPTARSKTYGCFTYTANELLKTGIADYKMQERNKQRKLLAVTSALFILTAATSIATLMLPIAIPIYVPLAAMIITTCIPIIGLEMRDRLVGTLRAASAYVQKDIQNLLDVAYFVSIALPETNNCGYDQEPSAPLYEPPSAYPYGISG